MLFIALFACVIGLVTSLTPEQQFISDFITAYPAVTSKAEWRWNGSDACLQSTACVCNFTGITCNDSHIVNITLNGQNGTPLVGGQLPASISGLQFLQFLDLEHHLISSTIPPELFNLPNVMHIIFDDGLLYGSLPDIPADTKIVQLVLSENALSGVIPRSFMNVAWVYLALDVNEFVCDVNTVDIIRYVDQLSTVTHCDFTANIFGGNYSQGVCGATQWTTWRKCRIFPQGLTSAPVSEQPTSSFTIRSIYFEVSDNTIFLYRLLPSGQPYRREYAALSVPSLRELQTSQAYSYESWLLGLGQAVYNAAEDSYTLTSVLSNNASFVWIFEPSPEYDDGIKFSWRILNWQFSSTNSSYMVIPCMLLGRTQVAKSATDVPVCYEYESLNVVANCTGDLFYETTSFEGIDPPLIGMGFTSSNLSIQYIQPMNFSADSRMGIFTVSNSVMQFHWNTTSVDQQFFGFSFALNTIQSGIAYQWSDNNFLYDPSMNILFVGALASSNSPSNSSGNAPTSVDTTAIAVGVSVSIGLVIIAVVIVSIVYWKHRKALFDKEDDRLARSLDLATVEPVATPAQAEKPVKHKSSWKKSSQVQDVRNTRDST